MASSVLGIPMKKIHTIESNTAIIPNPIQTGASMGMDLFGPAVYVILIIIINNKDNDGDYDDEFYY